jgi:hypothetical protein
MSSSGGGIIIIHNSVSVPNPIEVELTIAELEAIIAALPDGDLKTKLQSLLP